ncbi:Gfo/Idh/MocA family oxidoreductase [Nonomuraea gerenzanensis]|uniref:Myo-inositol 2-dehydrogenase n=1 Tax=Nonomuraea gerenzanensis TaxID=93944 RepID=A0A1M4EK74_9ACTN|nr:Gfo/Idh/MocA family oxidoreductase [Nonomuraea gerenzanensis]UBU10837.1 Gfo/Idh/MocA family oxidoreductase [Nonomuraea gerenzanensis]SBO99271.1 Myo-inositol 2-dehydrogenase [Nonomuraea gerenzanensis]
MSEIRVGLVGYGTAGAYFHAPLIHATPGLSLVAVVTGNPDRQAEVAGRYGAAAVTDVRELFERCDLVVVASPNRTHVATATAALTAGLPVVVDKPLARTAEEGRELVRLAKERGVLLTVFQNRRWDGDFRTVRRLAGEGRLGEVLRLESRFERWRPVPKGGWRESGGPEEVGGLLYDLGSHLVDQAMQLLGPVREVYCESDVRRAGVSADDDTFIALTHAGGARSHLWASSMAARLGPRFRVLGSAAAFVKYGMDVQEERLRAGMTPDSPGFGDDEEERWGVLGTEDDREIVRTEPGAYLDFYRGVAAALREGAAPPVAPESAVDALAVIEAARLSATERIVVRLDA